MNWLWLKNTPASIPIQALKYNSLYPSYISCQIYTCLHVELFRYLVGDGKQLNLLIVA